MPDAAHHLRLLLCVGVGVVGLIFLIARWKIHAFIALTVASVFVGVASGMPFGRSIQAFQDGVGAMLGSVAVVVGLGMILGKLLTESGGAQVIADTLIRAGGERRLAWTVMLVGFVVGIPVFFTVGIVLLTPILYTLLRRTGHPLLYLGIPLAAGLSAVHGLVPPHPGPMAAIGVTKADTGKTILYGLVVALPAAVIAGPWFGRFISSRLAVSAGQLGRQFAEPSNGKNLPGFGLSLFTVVLPVLLMLMATSANLVAAPGSLTARWLEFAGSPVMAMLLATLFALYSFGLGRGVTCPHLLKYAEESLAPAGSILLVVGAGGGFNRVLVASGVGEALASLAGQTHLSPLLLGWCAAALIRIATGSATVAVTTAAGIVAPFAATVPGTSMELLVVAMGAGSLVLSHVNDGGFWFVKEYFGLDVAQTLKSWTVMETILSVVALGFVLILGLWL